MMIAHASNQTRPTSERSSPCRSDLLAGVAARTLRHIATTGDRARRAIAQVFTPAPIARFMAARVAAIGEEFHVIDAGAGVGVLAAAMCERIAALTKPHYVRADLYETDPAVFPVLRETMNHCREVLAAKGHVLTVTLYDEDFVLHRPADLLYAPSPRTVHSDVVLMNPPYAKSP